jgi:hypothetical protein
MCSWHSTVKYFMNTHTSIFPYFITSGYISVCPSINPNYWQSVSIHQSKILTLMAVCIVAVIKFFFPWPKIIDHIHFVTHMVPVTVQCSIYATIFTLLFWEVMNQQRVLWLRSEWQPQVWESLVHIIEDHGIWFISWETGMQFSIRLAKLSINLSRVKLSKQFMEANVSCSLGM